MFLLFSVSFPPTLDVDVPLLVVDFSKTPGHFGVTISRVTREETSIFINLHPSSPVLVSLVV